MRRDDSTTAEAILLLCFPCTGDNDLEGKIPESLGNLSSLEILRLRTNYLSGEIPESFTSLSSLKVLRLEGNELTGGADRLCKLNLTDFQTDCQPSPPIEAEISCSCCTRCCFGELRCQTGNALPPENDMCEGALLVSPGSTIRGSTAVATFDQAEACAGEVNSAKGM